MKYKYIQEAVFLERPNRFIAYCQVGDHTETVHVKNTGRCRELLVPGARVYLEKSSNPNRKTAYDLVTVETPFGPVNMDAGAPNVIAGELLHAGAILPSPVLVRPEVRFGSSRLDFYAENDKERLFVEVKGVTLRQGACAVFPDAPTARGAKHMGELVQAVEQGYRAMALLIVQMGGCSVFRPNWDTDPNFCQALCRAQAAGVEVRAVDCRVTPQSVMANQAIPVDLQAHKNC